MLQELPQRILHWALTTSCSGMLGRLKQACTHLLLSPETMQLSSRCDKRRSWLDMICYYPPQTHPLVNFTRFDTGPNRFAGLWRAPSCTFVNRMLAEKTRKAPFKTLKPSDSDPNCDSYALRHKPFSLRESAAKHSRLRLEGSADSGLRC